MSLKDALQGCWEILDGVHDDLPVEAIYFSGSSRNAFRLSRCGPHLLLVGRGYHPIEKGGDMPRDLQTCRTPLDVLNYEIVQEQASALGRTGRALEAALAKDLPASAQQARCILVLEASHAL